MRGDDTRDGGQLRELALPFFGKSIVLRLPAQGSLQSDLVVLEQATKNLDTYLILVLRKILGKPTALWGHGMTITERQGRMQAALQRWMLRRADWFIGYTRDSESRALQNGAAAGRTSHVNNTIDAEGVARHKEDLLPDPGYEGRWVALYIGGLDPSKRIHELLQIAKNVYERDKRFLLVVAGTGILESVVLDASHEPWLKFVGRVDDAGKARWGHGASILLVPGRVGLVVIDSFTLGLPIVTSRDSDHAPEFEYLDNENSVVTNDAEIVEVIIRLMQNDSMLLALQTAASADADKYSLDAMVSAFRSAVEQSMATPVRRRGLLS